MNWKDLEITTSDDMTQDDLDLLVRYAKEYESAVLPTDIERGAAGKCFDWSALQAARHRQYQYVEGIATDPTNPGIWLWHAWLTDGIRAFDPTWQSFHRKGRKRRYVPVPSRYIGIDIDILDVHLFMLTTGYQGVLVNRWRSPKLAQAILAKKNKLTPERGN